MKSVSRNSPPSSARQTEIRITWTGDAWQCEFPAETSGLTVGATFVASLEAAAKPAPVAPPAPADPLLMFEAGTTLYLEITPKKNEMQLRKISDACWRAGPFLKKRPEGDLVPIRLLEDLKLKHLKGELPPLADCRCAIDGLDETFKSLNQACRKAHKQWTDNKGGEVNAIAKACFVHNSELTEIDKMRKFLVSGTPLPPPPPEDPQLPGLEVVGRKSLGR